MTDSNAKYEVGDWVVHNFYGIGQIKRVEVRPIHGKKTKCFRVNTKDAAFWFPKDIPDNPRIRPIASQSVLRRVKRELKKSVEITEKDNKIWKARIEKIKADNDLIEFSQLIRDLTGLSSERKLNLTEDRAIRYLTNRLTKEWSIIMGIDVEGAQHEMESILFDSVEQKA